MGMSWLWKGLTEPLPLPKDNRFRQILTNRIWAAFLDNRE